jgi:uroporphyrinogen-III synthase
MFCVGEITAGAAISAFPGSTLLDTAATAGELANRIVASGTGDSAGITFFCGDHRRDELPSMVRSGGSTMKEIVAYQTIKTPHVIDNDYDGGIFFSPSAVQSFFSVNDARRVRHFFATGKTTANSLREQLPAGAAAQIIVAGRPGRQEMLRTVTAFFQKNSIHS